MSEAATFEVARCLRNDTRIYNRMRPRLGHVYRLNLQLDSSLPSALTFVLPLISN